MRKTSVTIAIPAYNEEANIAYLLESILKQDQSKIEIEQIIVVSDKSSDQTVVRAKEVRDERIKIIDNRKRVGKSTILNRFFSMNKSDILVLLDGDVLPYSTQTVSNLVKPIINDKKVGLVGGNLLPLEPVSFIDQGVFLTRQVFRAARLKWRKGHNIYSCEGGILAISKRFSKQIVVPGDMIANDRFLYFTCISKGYKFRHSRLAKAWYKLPTTLNDHIKQGSRFIAAHYRLAKMFPEIAQKEHTLPKKYIYQKMLEIGMRKPLHILFIILVNRYCQYLALKDENVMNAKWAMAKSTKFGLQK